MSPADQEEVRGLRAQAVALAGRAGDLAQRAAVYHHLYRHSGGNHAFPLLAAHGALWGGGHFRRNLARGRIAARLLSGPRAAERRIAELERLADAFREINRRVCVETWFVYQLTARPALADAADALVAPELLAAMARCHAARRGGVRLSAAERRALFETFFRWEQEAIVGPAVEAAFAACDWTLARSIARRPRIAFAYLPRPLAFADFASTAERIAKGLAAFDAGETVGWTGVETALASYGVHLPTLPAILDAPSRPSGGSFNIPLLEAAA
ncbi:hypothetical protein [Sphingomonas aerophila]|uniref:Uncharacterized protein n=1 Tax=Sphingomonas aerophila TaxID=1344948 RepID=A0A7W9BFU7_9SPHN|nr:hypothetical protein [Sphingomonas aerophila]MBB5716484.1 hypothetical protein [Sphingomonas aerophila]